MSGGYTSTLTKLTLPSGRPMSKSSSFQRWFGLPIPLLGAELGPVGAGLELCAGSVVTSLELRTAAGFVFCSAPGADFEFIAGTVFPWSGVGRIAESPGLCPIEGL